MLPSTKALCMLYKSVLPSFVI